MKTKLNLLCAALLLGVALNAQDGQKLFKANCGVCHTIGKGKLVGPDLKDAHTRHKEEWLSKWIKSSQSLVKKGDPVAVKLFEENNKLVMPDPAVTDAEIKTIIAFIKETSEKPVEVVSAEKPKENVAAAPQAKQEAYDYRAEEPNQTSWKAATFVLAGFCIILVIVVIALANIIGGIAKTTSSIKSDENQVKVQN